MDRNKLVCVRNSLILFNVTFLVRNFYFSNFLDFFLKTFCLKAFGLMITFFAYFGLNVNESLLKVFFELSPNIRTVRKCFTLTGLLIVMNAIFGLTAILKKRLSVLIAVS